MRHLLPYILDPENAQTNFDLGLEYELQGQTGAAISFYLRTAERATSDVLQYEALLRMALCFEQQRTRDDTEKAVLQSAIVLMIHRPEAYFLLSRLHEVQREWHDSYTMACIGLDMCDFAQPGLTTHVQYPGRYGLLFQKGVAAWWVGRSEESREIMHDLKVNYDLDDRHWQAVNRNLKVCGQPKHSPASTTYLGRYLHTLYDDSMQNDFRLKFAGLDTITRNHSQSFQDMFVLAALDGLRQGTYLEIGSADPIEGNNTALLEQKFDWRGISVDIDATSVEKFQSLRRNPVLCADATAVDWCNVLAQLDCGHTIDYLQIDCDPPAVSLQILRRIPFDQYRFAVITFEHDYYVDQSVRDQSRELLGSLGYELLVSDVAYNRIHSYEDWWVHPRLVSARRRDALRDCKAGVKFARDWLLG